MAENNSFNRTETLRLKIAASSSQDTNAKSSGDTQSAIGSKPHKKGRSERLFDELLESVYDAVFITKTDGTILRQNKQAGLNFEIPDSDLADTNILDLILGSENEHLDSIRQRLSQAGRVWIEAYCSSPHGGSFPAEITANLIHFTGEKEGELCFFIRDTTTQMKTEEELETERYLMKQLMEQSNDRIYFKDCRGHFLRVSRQWLKNVGLNHPTEAVGKSASAFFDPKLVKESELDEQKIISSGKPILNKLERVFDHNSEGNTWLSSNKGPLVASNGSILGTFGVSRDITTQKRYEQTLSEQNKLMETDLRVAREIQQAFLQHDLPSIPADAPAEQSALQFWTYYLPSGAIGGDFFNIMPLNETSTGIWICDVMGHDVRAALIMASLHGLSQKMESVAEDPGAFLTEVNSSLCSILERAGTLVFTSAFYMVVNAAKGSLTYASAGHCPPFYRNGETHKVSPLSTKSNKQSPALGLFRDTYYQSHKQVISPGDQVTLFTDGLYEVHDDKGESYGLERLKKELEEQGNLPRQDYFPAMLDRIKEYSEDKEFEDDVCIVNVEFAHHHR